MGVVAVAVKGMRCTVLLAPVDTVTPPHRGEVVGLIACASHSSAILQANLARSPCLAEIPLHVEEGAPSAAIAYNCALRATDAELVIFVHHDVFLPKGWDRVLAARLSEVEAQDPDWALYLSLIHISEPTRPY